MRRLKGMFPVIVILLVILLLFGAYNLFRFPAAFRDLSDESLPAEQVGALRAELAAREDKKILVAYFSYSGTTKAVAEALVSQTGGDLFEIAPSQPYANHYTQGNMEIRRGDRPELRDQVENMEEYDIVFVGYPKMEQGYICV